MSLKAVFHFQPYLRRNNLFLQAVIVNALVLIISIYIRPLIPPDETRYISVAWEMHTNKNFLIPLLNQEPYSHKPPLLFWLINLFWSVFGNSEVVARFAISIFSLGNLFIVRFLAKLIYPENSAAQSWAPLILASFLLWNIYCSLIMFDCLLSFFVLSYVACLLLFCQGKGVKYVLFAGLLCGLSMLTKGPVALIYSLPVLFLYPFWRDKLHHKLIYIQWYFGVLTSVIFGLFFLLIWAFPAARFGGSIYANQLFWTQTFDRISGVLAHLRPWYWYLPFIPLSLIPISLSRSFWKKSLFNRPKKSDLFCILWFLVPVVLFSMIRSKQLHYLVPILPALAIFWGSKKQNWNQSKIILIIINLFFSLICFFLPLIYNSLLKNVTIFSLSQIWSIIPLILSLIIILWGKSTETIDKMSLLGTPICILALLGTIKPILDSNYNLKYAAQQIALFQKQNRQIAVWEKYSDEYHFFGKLKNKLDVVNNFVWLQKNPASIVVYNEHKNNGELDKKSIVSFNYAGYKTYFIEAATLLTFLCQRDNNPSTSECNLIFSLFSKNKDENLI